MAVLQFRKYLPYQLPKMFTLNCFIIIARQDIRLFGFIGISDMCTVRCNILQATRQGDAK